MIKYYCEICGKDFFIECGEGSYTDHVLNFAGNRKITVNRGSDDCINDIFYCGSHIRQENDIMDRLKCFCLWDNADEELKQKVSETVKEMMKAAKEAEEYAEKKLFADLRGFKGIM